MSEAGKHEKSKKIRKSIWFWPVGAAATSLAGGALLALCGCRHRRMGWPVRDQQHSYQVCLECGAKRLFDEEKFCAYGPFRNDLNDLIARNNPNANDSANPGEAESPPIPRAKRPAS